MLPHRQLGNDDPAPCSSNLLGRPESRVAPSPICSTSLPVSDQVSWKSEHKFAAQIVARDPQALRPHPSYARLGLAVPADKVSALKTRGDFAFLEPLAVTRDWIIIDGYARWALANQLKRRILHCVEYDLSENEALEWLLQRHCRSAGLNDYSRIMLAWDLEPALVEKARANRQRGGREKGWSNLTTAEQVHVRSEIAKAAVVSTGNVTKVKQLNETCAPELIAALYDDEISIHWAWKLRNESPEYQLDSLGRFRFEKALLKDVRKLAACRQRSSSAAPQDWNELVNGLTRLADGKLQTLRVGVIKGTRPEIFITEELARMIGMEQRRLWNQSAVYSNSPKAPERCGTKKGVCQAVRDNLDKITKCRTPALGAEIYASERETKRICHTCKSRFCPGCGNRATLLWQREQWRVLPDVRYSEICFTMPKQFWSYFREDKRFLSDIAVLAASVIRRWVQAN